MSTPQNPSESSQESLPLLPQCQTCYTRSKELRICSGCRRFHYCSPECQKKDWAQHKAFCRANAATATRIEEISKANKANADKGSQGQVVDVQRLADDLKKWTRAQTPLLTWAALQALRLRTNPANVSSACLQISLERTPSPDPSRCFKVGVIGVLPMTDMLAFAEAKGMRDAGQEAIRRAQTAYAQKGQLNPLILLTSGPIVHMVPAGVDGVPDIVENDNWETAFRRAVLGG